MMFSSVRWSLYWRWSGDEAMKRRTMSASVRLAASMSSVLSLDRTRVCALSPCCAIVFAVCSSVGLTAGNPISISGMPMSSRSCAMVSFCDGVYDMVGICSPSLRVLSYSMMSSGRGKVCVTSLRKLNGLTATCCFPSCFMFFLYLQGFGFDEGGNAADFNFFSCDVDYNTSRSSDDVALFNNRYAWFHVVMVYEVC